MRLFNMKTVNGLTPIKTDFANAAYVDTDADGYLDGETNFPSLGTEATTLAGGAAGSIVVQTALDTTGFLPVGATNSVVASSGTGTLYSCSAAVCEQFNFNERCS